LDRFSNLNSSRITITALIAVLFFGGYPCFAAERGLSDIPAELVAGTVKKRDPACIISAEAVLKMLKEKEDVLLIDVRGSEEFKRFRIRGSLNIPLDFIKTKAFLKNRKTVLVDEAYRHNHMEAQCRNLRAGGFTPFILYGGFDAWQDKGGVIEGDPFARKEIREIPPWTFFEEKGFDDWLVIDISGKHRSERSIPQALHVPLAGHPDKAAAKLKIAAGKEQEKIKVVVICDEKGTQYEKVGAIVEWVGLKNIVYLKDGLQGYERFLQERVLLKTSKGDRLKKMTGCKSCGQ
jgi:rhodanese-related sulfurtransferase